MSEEYFIISVYCLIDDIYKKILRDRNIVRLRSAGPEPKLSDSEVIAIVIVGEFLGFGYDKGIWKYFKTRWISLFPDIGDRTRFVRRITDLWKIIELIQKEISNQISYDNEILIFDGFPIPICNIKRYSKHKNSLKQDGAFGYCAAKDNSYFGFKGHLLININGAIQSFSFAPANIDERAMLIELMDDIDEQRNERNYIIHSNSHSHGHSHGHSNGHSHGHSNKHVIADKGLIGGNLKEDLKNYHHVELHTPYRKNMQDNRPRSFLNIISNKRRKIETVIGQLVERFKIQSIKAKNLFSLTVKITRKILAHSICFLINNNINPDHPMQFDRLIDDNLG